MDSRDVIELLVEALQENLQAIEECASIGYGPHGLTQAVAALSYARFYLKEEDVSSPS